MSHHGPGVGSRGTVLRIARTVRAAALVAAQGALVVMFLTMLALVVSRYVLNDAIHWAEELSRFCMIWMAFLGASVLTLDRDHVRLDILIDHLPKRFGAGVDYAIDLAAIAFHGLILWQGTLLVRSVGIVEAASLGVSMLWPYLAIPVASAIMLFFLVVQVVAGHEPRHGGGAPL